ncbi:unnamed protein product [Camellia sinensis]
MTSMCKKISLTTFSVKVSSKQLPPGELRRRLPFPIPFFNRPIGANVWLPRDLLGIYRLLAEAIFVAMDRVVSAISSSAFLCLFLVFSWLFQASGNAEGDALIVLKTNLADPNNVLQNWNSTLVNPCNWFNVTCNSENSVTRVDLGNANLSGQLVPQLGLLLNLQYLELYSNNISGRIPIELGNLTSLVSLDLYLNNLSGIIPDTLGRLQKLRFLINFHPKVDHIAERALIDHILHDRRLNNNTLSGTIPMSLTTISSLQSLDLSNNHLTGVVPVNGSFQLFTSSRFVAGNIIFHTSGVAVPLEPLLEKLLVVLPCCFSHLLGRAGPEVRRLRWLARVPNFEQNLRPPARGVYHVVLFQNYFNICLFHLFS